jgi:hypothetical protein
MAIPASAEETPEFDFLIFISEFTDDEGNWDAPELEDEPMYETKTILEPRYEDAD